MHVGASTCTLHSEVSCYGQHSSIHHVMTALADALEILILTTTAPPMYVGDEI